MPIVMVFRPTVALMMVSTLILACAASAAAPHEGTATEKPTDAKAPIKRNCTTSTAGTLPAGLDETSGLAVGFQHPDVLYAHNDSGDTPRFFAIDRKNARLLATIKLKNVEAHDWEDIAVGPCASLKASSCVYIADIGDNGKNRSSVQVYEVAEPLELKDGELSAETHSFTYKEGPQDAEALMVHPLTGDVFVVTKQLGGTARLYKVTAKGRSSSAELQASLTLSGGVFALPTASDFHPSGSRFAVRTYAGIYEYAWPVVKPGPLNEFTALQESQGEAVTYSRDGNTLYTASEGKNQLLHATNCTP